MNTRWASLTLEPEMASAEVAFLTNMISTRGQKGAHLEIGTGAGGTLRALLEVHGVGVRFVVVDPMTYFPDQLATVRLNLEAVGCLDSVEIRVMKSSRAYRLAQLRDESFDFVLIDGKHSESAVATDLRWANLVRCGGIVCVHDYGSPMWPGVTRAVDHFVRTSRNFDTIGRCETLIALQKGPGDGRGDRLRHETAPIIAWVRDRFRKRTAPTDIDAYVEWESDRLHSGFIHQTLGDCPGDDGGQDYATLLSLGLQPNHVVVDFGCGSLRLGRHLIPYLATGNYWGLDITDKFFRRAATCMDLSQSSRAPHLHVLSRGVLGEAAREQPHVVLVAGVLQVVPHDRLHGFFAVLASLCARHTQVLATVLESAYPLRRGRFGFRHTQAQVNEAAQSAGLRSLKLRQGTETQSSGAATSSTSPPSSRASLFLFTRQDHRNGVLAIPAAMEPA